jgi:replication-associated recombination protein RarA
MFLKDKIVPESINKFIINQPAANDIAKLFSKSFIQNLLVYGAPGAGKYTLVIKQLEAIVNAPICTINKTINVNNDWSSQKEAKLCSSEYHFEINLNKYSGNKNNLLSIIEAICESREINQLLPYKLLIITNIHLATLDIIKFIKQKAENSCDTTKFILIGNTKSNVLSALRGVFFTYRLEKPDPKMIITALKNAGYKIKKKEIIQLIEDSKYNLNTIFTLFELKQHTNFYKSRCESVTEKIVKLLKEKKLGNIYEIRELIYDYQVQNEDMIELFKSVSNSFLTLDDSIFSQKKKLELTSILSQCDTNKTNSYKEVIHIEYGIFSIFRLYHLP